MEQTKYVNLPLIGRIQHGEKVEGKGATELGYFIAKIQDVYMQAYLDKFNKLYKGKKSIDIELFTEEPLSIKYARYNQSGEVCSCMENSDMANQKTKNGWKQIQCTENCQYRQKNEAGKSACNRIGWFKFFIPSISKERIFLMRITGQTSINRLRDYFNLQKIQGNSIKGLYSLYLKQEEQSNSLGQTFNNYVLDILKKDDFISENTNTTPPKNDENVNIEKEQTVNTKQITATDNSKKPNEKTNKKSTVKQKKETQNKSVSSKEQKTNEEYDLDSCYTLLRTFNKTLTDKAGNPKEYLVGEFADIQDRISNILIRPEDAEELSKCDLGTVVKLDISEKASNKFALKLEFIEKTLKKVAV